MEMKKKKFIVFNCKQTNKCSFEYIEYNYELMFPLQKHTFKFQS